MYGNLSTTTATSEINENVESMSRFLTTNRNIELLEPYEGKLSCTVLRGEDCGNTTLSPEDGGVLSVAHGMIEISMPLRTSLRSGLTV